MLPRAVSLELYKCITKRSCCPSLTRFTYPRRDDTSTRGANHQVLVWVRETRAQGAHASEQGADGAVVRLERRGRHRHPSNFRRAFTRHERAVREQIRGRAITLESFEDVLADIITLDQFSRVIYRKTAKAFSNDAAAASLARRALRDDAFMEQASSLERMFIEMPLMHSEDIADHESLLAMRGIDVRGIDVDGAHDDFAVKHYCVVRKFGRYPYRNKVLGRANTPEEQAYLDSRPSTYGQ